MMKTKVLASVLLALAVLLAQVGSAAAAAQPQETTPPPVTTETDENGETTVLVTLPLEDGTTRTVRISLADAITLGLIDETTQEPVAQLPEGLTIDPTMVLEEVVPEEPTEVDVHIISSLLAEFFFDGDQDMAVAIDSLHNGEFTYTDAEGTEQTMDQVFGFGVIAQALWMSQDLNEEGADVDLAGEILFAKQDKDFQAFFDAHPEYLEPLGLSEGDELPGSWGQFKKALKTLNENKDKHNLGAAHQDQAEDGDDATVDTQNDGNKKPKKVKTPKPPKNKD
jgi:hypothetical protein